jgi:soluble lytic murein transglycosylase-like protein
MIWTANGIERSIGLRATAALLFVVALAGGAAEARAQSKQPPAPRQSTQIRVGFSRAEEKAEETPAAAEEKAPEIAADVDHGAPGHFCSTGDAIADAAVLEAATAYGVDPCLVVAVMGAESGYRRYAVSPKGACGYMQLMPATARRFGAVDVWDTRQNIGAGTLYLRWLLDRFGSVELALAGYNAGEGAIERYGRRIPPFYETQNYVRLITRRYAVRHAGLTQVRPAVAKAPAPPPAPPRLAARPGATWQISVAFEKE